MKLENLVPRWSSFIPGLFGKNIYNDAVRTSPSKSKGKSVLIASFNEILRGVFTASIAFKEEPLTALLLYSAISYSMDKYWSSQ